MLTLAVKDGRVIRNPPSDINLPRPRALEQPLSDPQGVHELALAHMADLVEAVAFDALSALARSMEAELAKCRPAATQAATPSTAWTRSGAAMCTSPSASQDCSPPRFAPRKTTTHTGDAPVRPGDHAAHSGDESRGAGDSGLRPGELLEQALDGMLDAGVLDAADRNIAATNAWAAVHGLSGLLLGPMAGQAPSARETLIDAFLDLVGRGLITRKTT
jgi:hypothetical protein